MRGPAGKAAVVSGSLAFDLFFRYRGNIRDHFEGTNGEILRSLNFRTLGPEHRTGGCGGNVALNLAMLGIPSLLDSWIGDDGELYLRSLIEAGVDTRGVYRCRSCPTPTGVLVSDASGEQIIVFGEPAGQPVWDLPAEDLLGPALERASGTASRRDALAFPGPSASDAGLAVVTALPPERFERIIPYLSARNFSVIADPGKVILDLTAPRLSAALEHASILVMNRHEYGLIQEHLGLLWKVLKEKIPAIIVTDGAEGARIEKPRDYGKLDADRTVLIPAYPVPAPADPYGAGDAFLAGFAAGRFFRLPLDTSARIGTAAASFALEAPGSQSHHFDVEELARRYASLTTDKPASETPPPPADLPLSDVSGGFPRFFTALARAAAGPGEHMEGEKP